MSLIVKAGKKGKAMLKKVLKPAEKHYVGYCRRIERIQTNRRICAMTFDDGPMNLPASPDNFGGKPLTAVLLDALNAYGAKGTFDVVGDTGANYPDVAGSVGTAAWGGTAYDHYPDFKKDEFGGAVHNEALIRRMLDEGHMITNHGYQHIIFGKKSVVYGKRHYLGSYDAVLSDLTRLDTLMKERYGYSMRYSRPPHYVDKIGDGFTSYDVYEAMGYQYMAASYDGGGWLPSTAADAAEAYQAEVDAMVHVIQKELERDPDAFCGQIIFQKDGCNMAKRTPVADALPRQLELLSQYGYQVVTVGELMEESPFRDVGRDDPDFDRLCALEKTHAIAYTDNTLRLAQPMCYGELAMLLMPKKLYLEQHTAVVKKLGRAEQPYAAALHWCKANGLVPPDAKANEPVRQLPPSRFDGTHDLSRRGVLRAFRG